MRKTNNNNILHFQKNINKQKTTKSFKAFSAKSLITLILFTTLFFSKDKIEATIKITNKDKVYLSELKIKLTYIKKEEDPLMHKKYKKHKQKYIKRRSLLSPSSRYQK
jgi:hypothetical protein